MAREALSTAYRYRRVKRILIFDISIFSDARRHLLEAINVPIAWVERGPLEINFLSSDKDYGLLHAGLPASKANLDTGHYGTFLGTNGGKFGKAVVYLQWQFRGDVIPRDRCLNASSPDILTSQNWTVEFKNWQQG